MLEYLFFALFGTLLGVFSGLVPGFHANNIALIALWISGVSGFDPLLLSITLVSAGVAHAFSSFAPSIFLGAPSEDTALAVSPGHRMLLLGRGFEALTLSVVGGLFGTLLVLAGFFLLRAYALPIYSILKGYLGILLVLVATLMIVVEKRKTWALFIFLLSGLFGIVSLNSPINEKFVLLPVLSGLFGASTLVLSYKNAPNIPKQKMRANISLTEAVHGSTAGFLGGVIAGFLPGVGTSQSAIIVQRITGMSGARKFIMALGAIGAADVILSVLALSFIGRTRSGIAAATEMLLGALRPEDIYLFLGAGLFAAGIAAFATIKIGRTFAQRIVVSDTRKLSASVLLFLLILSAAFAGLLGIIIFVTGCAIGVLPHIVGTKKSLLLSCLLLPTMLYFLGVDRTVLQFLGL